MAYRCNDCSFKHKGPFANGRCPACGGANIYQSENPSNNKRNPHTKNWQTVLMAALWVFLVAAICQKLLS